MQTSTQKPTPQTEQFFFSGGTEYLPTTITATSREAAEAEWQKVRVPVEPAAIQPTPTTPKTSAPISKPSNA